MQRNKPASPNLSFDFREAPRGAVRACEHAGCCDVGEFRAPKSRSALNDYWWFCLEHVREYNKSWDFYAGMDDREIETHIRHDTTWQRPTWPMGNWRAREKAMRERMYAGGFAFGAEWGEERQAEAPKPRPRTPEDEALAVLDLEPGADFAEVKKRYRQLAKKHHPDANGGSKEAEERLKRINQAYNTLKASHGSG